MRSTIRQRELPRGRVSGFDEGNAYVLSASYTHDGRPGRVGLARLRALASQRNCATKPVSQDLLGKDLHSCPPVRSQANRASDRWNVFAMETRPRLHILRRPSSEIFSGHDHRNALRPKGARPDRRLRACREAPTSRFAAFPPAPPRRCIFGQRTGRSTAAPQRFRDRWVPGATCRSQRRLQARRELADQRELELLIRLTRLASVARSCHLRQKAARFLASPLRFNKIGRINSAAFGGRQRVPLNSRKAATDFGFWVCRCSGLKSNRRKKQKRRASATTASVPARTASGGAAETGRPVRGGEPHRMGLAGGFRNPKQGRQQV